MPGFMGIGDESPHTFSLSEPIRAKQVREVLTIVQYCPRPTIGDYLI